jgi:hypothetical protein
MRREFVWLGLRVLVRVLGGTLVGTLAGTWGGVANADSMRCGKWIVNESSTVDELLSKCGQPQSRESRTEDNYALNPNGARVKTGAKTVTERWVYKPTPGALPMAVTVVDGKVVEVTRAD